jgi:hypothetical protein
VGGWENKQKYSARNSLGHLNGCSACSQALPQISLLFPNFFLLLFTERLTFLSFFFFVRSADHVREEEDRQNEPQVPGAVDPGGRAEEHVRRTRGDGRPHVPGARIRGKQTSKQASTCFPSPNIFIIISASESVVWYHYLQAHKQTNKQTNKRGRRNHNCDYYYYYYYYYYYTTIRII